MFFHRILIVHYATQNSRPKQMGVAPRSSFVERFGQSKVKTVGLILSGAKKTFSESLGRRKNGLIADGTALERSDAEKTPQTKMTNRLVFVTRLTF